MPPTARLLYRPDGIVNEATMNQSAEPRIGSSDARNRIIAAAEALALERGPGNISIEAVAARAGFSKGGVLYHFRTKADLLEALVSCHIDASRDLVEESLARRSGPNALAEALIDAHRRMTAEPKPAPSGVLAAVAEHPDFLEPLRAHQKEVVARLRSESSDPDLATMSYLALEGLKALHLFGFDLLDPDEEEAVLARMISLLRSPPAQA